MERTDSMTKRSSSRVFKKTCSNGKMTLYLSKRDFLDHLSRVDVIDGVVLLDPDHVKDRIVYAQVLATFRYGVEDLDVLGLAFRKDLFLASVQVYPPISHQQEDLTPLQQRLLKKLGSKAFPFTIELPHHSPASVTLQPSMDTGEKPCGVEYELSCFMSDVIDNRATRRDEVTLAIRKLTYAPEENPEPPPIVEVNKDFRNGGCIHIEASLDKEKYFHGETITVHVLVDNQSTKKIKSVRVTAFQVADVMLYNKAAYQCPVDEIESEDDCPILPNQRGWSKMFHLCPLLSNNRDKYGLALDGKLKAEDTNLASSTIIKNKQSKENLGIIVSYHVAVRLCMGFATSDVVVKLPFTLTHPRPYVEKCEDTRTGRPPSPLTHMEGETDLIQLETRDTDDLLFQDFVHTRSRGTVGGSDDELDA